MTETHKSARQIAAEQIIDLAKQAAYCNQRRRSLTNTQKTITRYTLAEEIVRLAKMAAASINIETGSSKDLVCSLVLMRVAEMVRNGEIKI